MVTFNIKHIKQKVGKFVILILFSIWFFPSLAVAENWVHFYSSNSWNGASTEHYYYDRDSFRVQKPDFSNDVFYFVKIKTHSTSVLFIGDPQISYTIQLSRINPVQHTELILEKYLFDFNGSLIANMGGSFEKEYNNGSEHHKIINELLRRIDK